ncbi:TetR/AcrR family transcriptional regulator [Micromonospora sp. NPDC049679]|uniref:TetR/AcrR family transcriptional regulator n=1 Tax=Micromonospora sp. NPDC049679 TaxID=3155920 RepID=UPI0033D6C6C9
MVAVNVDHEAGRARLADIVCDVVADGGLEAVSVRAVASAAGVSIGAVQHYFRTKEAMLLAAHERANAKVGARAEAAAAAATTPRDALRTILLSVLPNDEPSRRDLQVFIAFETAALHSPRLAEQARRSNAELYAAFEELFRLAGTAEPRREAIAAVGLLGLCQPLLLADPYCSLEDAIAVVDAHLDRALPR